MEVKCIWRVAEFYPLKLNVPGHYDFISSIWFESVVLNNKGIRCVEVLDVKCLRVSVMAHIRKRKIREIYDNRRTFIEKKMSQSFLKFFHTKNEQVKAYQRECTSEQNM